MRMTKFLMSSAAMTLACGTVAQGAVGSHTLLQTDYSNSGGTSSWATGVYNDSGGGGSAYENRDDSSAADVRDLGPDGITAPDTTTTRKRIAVMKWDLASIVGPGETISSITLSTSNKGTNTGAALDFYVANEGTATDIQGATLEEPDIYAGTWAGYNYAGPVPAGGAIPDSPADPNGFIGMYDSTIPLDFPQFSLIGSPAGTNVATAGVIYTQVITDGALLAAANADLNGSLIVAVLPTSDRGVSLARGNDASAMRLDVTVVPEPASLGLLGLGGLAMLRRR